MCFLPYEYKYRKILEIWLKLMKLCALTGGAGRGRGRGRGRGLVMVHAGCGNATVGFVSNCSEGVTHQPAIKFRPVTPTLTWAVRPTVMVCMVLTILLNILAYC